MRSQAVARNAEEGMITMRFLRHLGLLLAGFFGFAWQNKAWWIVPIVFFLLLITLVIVTGQATAPFIYTLF